MKEYKYENSTVFIVIALLAIFIAFPPLARVFYPDEEREVINEKREFLYCSREDQAEGFRVTSSVFYLNDEPEKNSINFFDMKATASMEVADENPTGELVSEIIVLDRIDDVQYKVKTVFAELEFFKRLQGVNFIDNGTSYSVEVNQDSLIVNEGNEELKKYLMTIDKQENFYTGMEYSCYREVA